MGRESIIASIPWHIKQPKLDCLSHRSGQGPLHERVGARISRSAVHQPVDSPEAALTLSLATPGSCSRFSGQLRANSAAIRGRIPAARIMGANFPIAGECVSAKRPTSGWSLELMNQADAPIKPRHLDVWPGE